MNFRYSMSWLHTWSGLVFGWLLYFMFITGASGYFDIEIERWMQPEIPVQTRAFDVSAQLPLAEQRLRSVAPDAAQYYIEFPIGRSPVFSLWWHLPEDEGGNEGKGWYSEKLDPNTGEPVVTRETAGGEFLYRLHYALHYLPGRLAFWITSLASMFMLVAIVSGVITHRRIFKDFFTLRRKKLQRFWLDSHNLFSVLPLPFHIMITYSGLMLLMFSTFIAVPVSVFGGDKEKLKAVYDTVFSEPVLREPEGRSADSAPLIKIYNQALVDSYVDGKPGTISFVRIDHPGDEHALVGMGVVANHGIEAYHHYYYDAVSGQRYDPAPLVHGAGPAIAFYEVMEHLHEGLFAKPFLRWLYFLLSLMGAGMVATGIILWTVKRQETHVDDGGSFSSKRIVDGLNVGTIVGLPIAIAAYFWANRLVPSAWEARAAWEMNCLFLIWLLALVQAVWARRTKSSRPLWAFQLNVAAVLYGMIPVLNLVTTDNHLGRSLVYGDWVLAGFDLFMLALALGFAALSFRLRSVRAEVGM